MHFPKYWTTARHKDISAWGWSDHNLAAAEGHAAGRLMRIRDWLSRREKTPLQQRYGYGDNRPMREEVLREFRGADGTLRAAITRNSYGCLVLNTADLMFVDVDVPGVKFIRRPSDGEKVMLGSAPEAKEPGFWATLFTFRKPDKEPQTEMFLNTLMTRVTDWVGCWQGWGWRVYRTAAGVRLLATHEPFASDAAMCHTAFEVFEADPLYRKLCATQKCFRARLTPKPWRCDMDKPRGRWPWANEKTEARFRKWETQYNKAAARYATCELVGQFGHTQFHPAMRELIELHDNITQAESGLKLA